MAESSKVRLVRCPKCDNLLPELPGYSVYQCGACGIFLRAKKNGNLEGGKGFERSIEENVDVASEKSENLSGNSEDLVGKGRVFGGENGDRRVGDIEKEVLRLKFEIENMSLGDSELGNRNLSSKVNRMKTHVDNANGLRESDRNFDGNMSDAREKDQFGTRRVYFEEMRPSSSNYEGLSPSNYGLDSSYKREANRATRAEDVEPDREDLLRKLEELKDQLSKVQNGNNNYREKFPADHRMGPREIYAESEDYYRQMDDPSTFRHVSGRFFTPHKYFAGRPSYFDQYHEPIPFHQGYEMANHGYHNSIHGSSYVPRYEDPFDGQYFRRPHQRILTHQQYMSPELDHFESHPYDETLSHHSSSSYRCYDRQHQAPKYPHVPNTPIPYQRERCGAFGSQGYDSRIDNTPGYDSRIVNTPSYDSRIVNTPPSGSCELKSHSRWSSDLKLERDGRARPKRAVLAKGHHYRPIAGGAPFVTCRNCFELLKIPKKVFSKKGEWRISCGSCSFVMSFAIVDEKLASIDPSANQAKQAQPETMDNVTEMPREYLKRDTGSYCSEDYANAGYDFHAMDRDPSSSSTCYSLSSIKSEEMRNILSISDDATSEDECLSDDLEPRNVSSQERVITNKSSLKEALATEMEILPNEYDDTRLSKVASDKSQEDDELKSKKGDSFFGILKKSFRSNSIDESTKKNVMVNGHLIQDRLVKKAEKLSGPIYPGQYWYDYRAGFWGVIDGPCLGIIPPFIEEFNYPMPDKCGGGNTGVYVNGRELHQKDLDLLSSRGLPASKDRSYIVDITGKVVEEDTGKELVSLGKLAPTIEKVKHGFGMKAPKAVP